MSKMFRDLYAVSKKEYLREKEEEVQEMRELLFEAKANKSYQSYDFLSKWYFTKGRCGSDGTFTREDVPDRDKIQAGAKSFIEFSFKPYKDTIVRVSLTVHSSTAGKPINLRGFAKVFKKYVSDLKGRGGVYSCNADITTEEGKNILNVIAGRSGVIEDEINQVIARSR